MVDVQDRCGFMAVPEEVWNAKLFLSSIPALSVLPSQPTQLPAKDASGTCALLARQLADGGGQILTLGTAQSPLRLSKSFVLTHPVYCQQSSRLSTTFRHRAGFSSFPSVFFL